MAITIEEFNQLSELLEEQQRLNRRYKELQAQNTVAAPTVHMCGGKGYRACDRVGDLVAARDEVRQQFKDNADIMKGVIRRVESQRVRQIMQYRFLKGMTWRRVAAACGYQCEDSPRQILSRYKKALKSSGCRVGSNTGGSWSCGKLHSLTKLNIQNAYTQTPEARAKPEKTGHTSLLDTASDLHTAYCTNISRKRTNS